MSCCFSFSSIVVSYVVYGILIFLANPKHLLWCHLAYTSEWICVSYKKLFLFTIASYSVMLSPSLHCSLQSKLKNDTHHHHIAVSASRLYNIISHIDSANPYLKLADNILCSSLVCFVFFLWSLLKIYRWVLYFLFNYFEVTYLGFIGIHV